MATDDDMPVDPDQRKGAEWRKSVQTGKAAGTWWWGPCNSYVPKGGGLEDMRLIGMEHHWGQLMMYDPYWTKIQGNIIDACIPFWAYRNNDV